MCKPDSDVVIVGAGPAGLLAAILLLRRNNDEASSAPKYRVTLVDPGEDYGILDAEGLNRARSWMIGLSAHGLAAIQTVPDLYEKYIHGLGIDITHARFGLSPSIKFNLDAKDFLPEDVSAFTVDRNFICAALSRYLNDKFAPNEAGSAFVAHYQHRALYVDGDNHQIVVRPKDKQCEDIKLEYTYLLGCDGIRSVVRNAFVNKHRDFEFSLQGTFGYGKSVHVPLPPGIQPGTFMFLNDALPGWGSFVLPETGNKLNVALGTSPNKECPQALKSDDPKVVADYFRKHWHAFEIDADTTGEQWVNQGWNSISQVHCNFYHSRELKALLLGDAAHATSPQIGQGMNTALADAAALNALLDEHKDSWESVLPAFSKERVKEGNALTDLSFYTFSLSGTQQIRLMFGQQIRRTLNKLVPSLFGPDPMDEVGKGMKLSEAYHQMTKLGVLDKVRQTNDKIMRNHFELTTGMVRDKEVRGFASVTNNVLVYGVIPVVCAAAAWCYAR